MSSDKSYEKIDKILFRFVQGLNRESQARLFVEINKELKAFLSKENNDTDSIDGIFHFLSQISDFVQEEFDERLSEDSDKTRFVKAVTKIFALLLNTIIDTAEKFKRIIKIAIETTLKIWQEPRQQ